MNVSLIDLRVDLIKEFACSRRAKSNSAYISKNRRYFAVPCLVDPKTMTCTLLLKKLAPVATGRHKKVTRGLEVNLETFNVQKVVRLVNGTDGIIRESELCYEAKYGDLRAQAKVVGKKRTLKTNFTQSEYGHSLFDFRDPKRVPPYQCELLPVLQSVGQTLGRMHADGVVHNDIKLSNVYYSHYGDRDDCCRLGDFGLAYDAARRTRDKSSYGTLIYTAPESCAGQAMPHDPERRLALAKAGDMFALGCLLYELLFLKQVPWGRSMHTYMKEGDLAKKQEARNLLDQERKRIGEALVSLPEGAASRVFQMLHELLEPDPSLRMTIKTFDEHVGTFKQILLVASESFQMKGSQVVKLVYRKPTEQVRAMHTDEILLTDLLDFEA